MIGVPLRGMGVTYVACHEFHSAAVCDNGEVFTWGKAGPHLGYEVEGTKQLRPRLVHALSEQKITYVACGCAHTLACAETGRVYAFGSNKFGELGLGHNISTTTPTSPEALKDSIYKVACGRYHSACIDLDVALWMWGWGARGQLGQGDTKSSNVPVLVEAFK